jgi:type I restriction enzyme M protein
MREVLERFEFDNTIARLDEAGLLFKTTERFGQIDLHPSKVSNPMMGTIFEELIRKFNEALNENPGEHFTPRDVIHLMVDLLMAGDEDLLSKPGVVIKIFAALGDRDENAEICRDKHGNSEPDPELRDYENVPLSESVDDYFAREVTPYVSDAWINTSVRDDKDGEVGRVGYEINFNRYFYRNRSTTPHQVYA